MNNALRLSNTAPARYVSHDRKEGAGIVWGMQKRSSPAAVAIVAAALLSALPLWLVNFPAMPDYPAHLASYYVIAGGDKAPALASFYRVEWAFLPNLAGEIVVPLLSKLTGLELAARLFVSAAVAMWVIGPALVHRALYGRIGVAPLLGAFFAYNANFMWGFLNYYFAMGLAFLVFAAWIAIRPRRSVLHLAGFALAATVVYFCHLFALATLLLLIVSYEAAAPAGRQGEAPREALKRAAGVAIMFLPSALAFLFLRPGGGDNGIEFNLFETGLDRIDSAIQAGFDNPAYVLLALLTILLAVGAWRGWAVFHRRMIAALGVLALVTLLAPEWAMGGWGVDLRLPAVLGALAFASVEFRLERSALLALGAAALAVLGYNSAVLARTWRAYDRQFAEFRHAVHALPPGRRLLTVLDGDAMGFESDQPYWHMAEFAILDPGAFTPLMFTTKGQHIVQLQPPYRSIAAASAEQGSPPDISELDDLAAGRTQDDEDIAEVFPYLVHFQCHYDEAIVIDLDGPRSPAPPMLRLRQAGSFFAIYDVLPDSACGKG